MLEPTDGIASGARDPNTLGTLDLGSQLFVPTAREVRILVQITGTSDGSVEPPPVGEDLTH